VKKIIIIAISFFIAAAVYAEQFENPMLNMTVPSGLEDGQAYFVLNNNFLRTLHDYPTDDLYALFDDGVNMNLNFRYMTVSGLEAKVGYTTKNREQTAGISYVYKNPKLFLSSQLDVQFFSCVDYVHNNFDQNLFFLLSMQSVPLIDDKVVVSADAGYDAFNENIGLAIGLSYEVLSHLNLLAEYYPVFKGADSNQNIGTSGCYSFGIKLDTFGHQFIFKVGNSPDTGTRRLMLGTDRQDIYIGLTIMRLIAF
jgi:hypothetical protein